MTTTPSRFPRLEADIETRTGAAIGSGPLMWIERLTFRRAIQEISSWDAMLPLRDPRVKHLRPKATRLRFRYNGADVYLGVIETIGRTVEIDDSLYMPVYGRGIGIDLAEANIGLLSRDTDEFNSLDVPEQILENPEWGVNQQASLNWTITGKTRTDAIYSGQILVASGIDALRQVASRLGETFRVAPYEPEVEWLGDTYPSVDLRVMASVPDMVKGEGERTIAFFQTLNEVTDTSQQITRIFPFGSGGMGQNAVGIKWASGSVPQPYTIVQEGNALGAYAWGIANAEVEAELGYKIPHYVQYSISLADASETALHATSTAIRDAGLIDLMARDNPENFTRYEIGNLVGVDTQLLPGDRIWVEYDDDRFSVDEQMTVVETSTTIDRDGCVHQVIVNRSGRLPVTSERVIADALAEMQRPQPSDPLEIISSYYDELFNDEEPATFTILFNESLRHVQRVWVTFQIVPFVRTERRYTLPGTSTEISESGIFPDRYVQQAFTRTHSNPDTTWPLTVSNALEFFVGDWVYVEVDPAYGPPRKVQVVNVTSGSGTEIVTITDPRAPIPASGTLTYDPVVDTSSVATLLDDITIWADNYEIPANLITKGTDWFRMELTTLEDPATGDRVIVTDAEDGGLPVQPRVTITFRASDSNFNSTDKRGRMKAYVFIQPLRI